MMTPIVAGRTPAKHRKRLTKNETVALRVRCKIWLENDDGKPIIGEGRLQILQAVRRTGSISKAAVLLNQPFRNVWGKIKDAEEQCGFKLLEKTRTGSKLTPEGERLVHKYADLARSCARSANDKFKRLFTEDD